MAKLAFLVAIEQFSDPKVRPVPYAENDVRKLGTALYDLGYETIMLVNIGATKAAIVSKLKKAIRRLGPKDTFCMFVASHGFSENGRNYIACHDTLADDLAGTSLSLQRILELLRKSSCRRSILFVDACETGVEIDESMRGIVAELAEDQLRESFEQAEFCMGFAACKADQKSHSSSRLQHGIWSYHLIRALSGQAPAATDGKQRITATSLQNYLSFEVPREVVLDRGHGAIQTPWVFGSLSRDFAIADLTALGTAQPTPPAIGSAGSYSLDDGRKIEFTLPAGGLTMDQVARFCFYLMSMSGSPRRD